MPTRPTEDMDCRIHPDSYVSRGRFRLRSSRWIALIKLCWSSVRNTTGMSTASTALARHCDHPHQYRPLQSQQSIVLNIQTLQIVSLSHFDWISFNSSSLVTMEIDSTAVGTTQIQTQSLQFCINVKKTNVGSEPVHAPTANLDRKL